MNKEERMKLKHLQNVVFNEKEGIFETVSTKSKGFIKSHLKDAFYIVIIGVICFFGYRAYQDLKSEVRRTHLDYKQLSETLARAENNMVSRVELKQFAKDTGINLKAIEKDLKNLGSRLSAVGETIASVEGKLEANTNSDTVVDHKPPEQPSTCKLCDMHEYTAHTQVKNVSIQDMPYARVEFDASKSKPWTIKTDDIDIKVTTVLGDDGKDGVTSFYHTIGLLNKSRPELADKLFATKITSSKFAQTLDNTKHFYWWSPHLDLNLDNGFTFSSSDFYRFGGSLGISIMGYGKTKDDQDWRFVRLGLGINSKENPYLTLEPVRYNVGKFLPLVSDIWLGIGVLWDSEWGVNISLGTTL